MAVVSYSGYWYCYTSVSSQINSPAIGYVKDTAEYIDIINETQQRTISSTIKLQPTIDNQEFFADIYTYIHTNKHPRIAPHLLHDYLPIANVLGNNYSRTG